MTERILAKTNFEFAEANKKLKEAQLQLIQRERLASIGHLAAGTAHEINNPLGFVKSNFKTIESYFDALLGYLAFLEKAVSADETRREEILRERTRLDIERILEDYRGLLDESRDGIERIITIVQNLKNFSRVDQQEAFHPFDFNKAVEAAIVIARNELKYVVKVELRLGDIPNPVCIGYEINQVLLNLILNAAQAVKSQGGRTSDASSSPRASRETTWNAKSPTTVREYPTPSATRYSNPSSPRRIPEPASASGSRTTSWSRIMEDGSSIETGAKGGPASSSRSRRNRRRPVKTERNSLSRLPCVQPLFRTTLRP